MATAALSAQAPYSFPEYNGEYAESSNHEGVKSQAITVLSVFYERKEWLDRILVKNEADLKRLTEKHPIFWYEEESIAKLREENARLNEIRQQMMDVEQEFIGLIDRLGRDYVVEWKHTDC